MSLGEVGIEERLAIVSAGLKRAAWHYRLGTAFHSTLEPQAILMVTF